MEKISVIIPVYNGEKYIAKCLDSIVNQTYKNLEIVCVNDGSKDNSLKILKEYRQNDDRIIILDKENAGVSAARNDGIKISTGEYITFVDVDDWLELDAIESLYIALTEKHVEVVRGNYYRNFEFEVNDSKGELGNLTNKTLFTKDEKFAEQVIDRFLDGTIPCFVVLLLMKRECILKTSLFRTDVQLMEDTIFYNELCTKIDSLYFLDKPIYHYYCNLNSCTKASGYYTRNMYNILKVNKYLKEIISSSKFNNKKRIQKMDALHLNLIVNHSFMMFKDNNSSKKSIKNELEKMVNNYEFMEIVDNADLDVLPIHLKIPIVLVIKKKYRMLFIFYSVRTIMSKIKDIIKNRKE